MSPRFHKLHALFAVILMIVVLVLSFVLEPDWNKVMDPIANWSYRFVFRSGLIFCLLVAPIAGGFFVSLKLWLIVLAGMLVAIAGSLLLGIGPWAGGVLILVGAGLRYGLIKRAEKTVW